MMKKIMMNEKVKVIVARWIIFTIWSLFLILILGGGVYIVVNFHLVPIELQVLLFAMFGMWIVVSIGNWAEKVLAENKKGKR